MSNLKQYLEGTNTGREAGLIITSKSAQRQEALTLLHSLGYNKASTWQAILNDLQSGTSVYIEICPETEMPELYDLIKQLQRGKFVLQIMERKTFQLRCYPIQQNGATLYLVVEAQHLCALSKTHDLINQVGAIFRFKD